MPYETVDEALRAALAPLLPPQRLPVVLASLSAAPMADVVTRGVRRVEERLEVLDTAVHLPWTKDVQDAVTEAARLICDEYAELHWQLHQEFERQVGVPVDQLASDRRLLDEEARRECTARDAAEKRNYVIASLVAAAATCDSVVDQEHVFVMVNAFVPGVCLPLSVRSDAVQLALGPSYQVDTDGAATELRSAIYTLDGVTPVAVPWEAIYAIARPRLEAARLWPADAPIRVLYELTRGPLAAARETNPSA